MRLTAHSNCAAKRFTASLTGPTEAIDQVAWRVNGKTVKIQTEPKPADTYRFRASAHDYPIKGRDNAYRVRAIASFDASSALRHVKLRSRFWHC